MQTLAFTQQHTTCHCMLHFHLYVSEWSAAQCLTHASWDLKKQAGQHLSWGEQYGYVAAIRRGASRVLLLSRATREGVEARISSFSAESACVRSSSLRMHALPRREESHHIPSEPLDLGSCRVCNTTTAVCYR